MHSLALLLAISSPLGALASPFPHRFTNSTHPASIAVSHHLHAPPIPIEKRTKACLSMNGASSASNVGQGITCHPPTPAVLSKILPVRKRNPATPNVARDDLIPGLKTLRSIADAAPEAPVEKRIPGGLPVVGSLVPSLPGLKERSPGGLPVVGSLVPSLPGLKERSPGGLPLVGSLVPSLPGLKERSPGGLPLVGSIVPSLPGLKERSPGGLPLVGSLVPSLPGLKERSPGGLPLVGSLVPSLPGL